LPKQLPKPGQGLAGPALGVEGEQDLVGEAILVGGGDDVAG